MRVGGCVGLRVRREEGLGGEGRLQDGQGVSEDSGTKSVASGDEGEMRTSCERSARVEELWVVVVDEGERAEETSDAEERSEFGLLRAPPPAARKG